MNRMTATPSSGISRFELAPPRRFMLPAILLLLSERPGYGYGLAPLLKEFRFGHVDRPAIYRALAQLERDGLVQASSQDSKSGQARRVYTITSTGERILRMWMGVIKEEHDYLGQVLRRYQATGTTEAFLAEVEGGWGATLDPAWSPVSPSTPPASITRAGSPTRRHSGPTDVRFGGAHNDRPVRGRGAEIYEISEPRRFVLVPDRSVVLIEVRSTFGPMSFGAIGVSGWVEAIVIDRLLHTDTTPAARLEIDVTGLSSGNDVYDAELQRRIDARSFPRAAVELRECVASGSSRFGLKGELTFHGVTRPASGTVEVEAVSDERLVITGEQVFDIRDFAIPSPTVLMLRIYPDVRVKLHAEAEIVEV